MTPSTFPILLALTAAFAAPSAAPVKSTETSPAAEASSVPTASDVIGRLKSLDDSLTGLQASFKQTLETGAGLRQEQTGVLYYQKPEKIRIDFQSPRPQVTVSDKKTLWIHQLEEKQVVKADWEDWKRSQSQMTGLLEFGNYSNLLEKHDATVEPFEVDEDTATPRAYKLTLKPKASKLYTLVLVVREPDYVPTHVELKMERMTIVNELSDVKINPTLDPALFKFEPPPGEPVIHLTAP